MKKIIYSNVQDDIPLDDLVHNTLNRIVKNYQRNHVVEKKIFSRYPQNKLNKIKQVRDHILRIY